MAQETKLESLSDDELLTSLSSVLQRSRRVEVELVAHIAEVDHRRLFAREACSSMFTYCVEILNLSESEAYMRIAVARASRNYPELLEMLGDGRLHLSGIAKLAPHLTPENCESTFAQAAHRSKREIEELVAALAPKPDVPAVIRKLPASRANAAPRPTTTPSTQNLQLRPDAVRSQPAPPRPVPKPEPLASSRYKVQFTASSELKEKLDRLAALMYASDPDAELADVIDAAVTEKLARLEAKRMAKTSRPRKSLEQTDTTPSSRAIPAAVKRTVSNRDGGRCTFVSAEGRRCGETNGLEFHHEKPFAKGGSHAPENVRLLCRSHNVYRAECDYGKDVMARYRHGANRVREPAPLYGRFMLRSIMRASIDCGEGPCLEMRTSWSGSSRTASTAFKQVILRVRFGSPSKH